MLRRDDPPGGERARKSRRGVRSTRPKVSHLDQVCQLAKLSEHGSHRDARRSLTHRAGTGRRLDARQQHADRANDNFIGRCPKPDGSHQGAGSSHEAESDSRESLR